MLQLVKSVKERELVMKKCKFYIGLLLTTIICSSHADSFDDAVFQLNRGNFKAAIAELKPLVVEGYAPAQYQMALVELNGWGVRKNAKAAFDLLSSSAAQNYPDAQFELSLMYSSGNTVKKDLHKAFSLMEKAADKGLASAQFNLGVMYYNGQGVAKDYYRASRWYEKAAEQNYVLAQYNLALMYDDGKGVGKNIEQSYFWNWIAAKSDYENAIKSRDLDERSLSVEQIKSVRERAEAKYKMILEVLALKAKKNTKRGY